MGPAITTEPVSLPSDDHSSLTQHPVRRAGAAVALCVAVQIVAYLLLWVQFHALPGHGRANVSSQDLVPTGWYEPGTAYTRAVSKLPGFDAVIHSNRLRHWVLAVSFTLAAAGYVGTLLVVRRRSVVFSARTVVLLTIAIALPLLFLPQLLSGDVWGYILYGRVAVLHGGNPIVDAPALWPTDPFLSRMYWKTTPSVYGPGWVCVCIALTWIAQLLGGAPWTYTLLFKGFIFLTHLANILLIRRILRTLRPGHETMGSLLYAINPLCMVEFAGSGHNDCLMLTLLLLGILAVVNGRSVAAVGGITAAGLTKLPGLLGLPLYVLSTARPWQRGSVKKLLGQGAVAGAIAVALYAPFWRGTATFHSTANAPNLRMMWHSLGSFTAGKVDNLLSHGHPKHYYHSDPPPGSRTDRIRTAVRRVSMTCFVICFIPLTLKGVRGNQQWLERLVCIYLAYLLFAAFQFNPWYGTWIVVLAALVRQPAPLLIFVSLSFLTYYFPDRTEKEDFLHLLPLMLAFGWEMARFLGLHGTEGQAGEGRSALT